MQPTTNFVGTSITRAMTVFVEDAYANIVTTAANPIAMAIGANPGSATLGGTTPVSAVAGIATFSRASTLSAIGTGYTLVARRLRASHLRRQLRSPSPGFPHHARHRILGVVRRDDPRTLTYCWGDNSERRTRRQLISRQQHDAGARLWRAHLRDRGSREQLCLRRDHLEHGVVLGHGQLRAARKWRDVEQLLYL